jgi:Flp pilus assembly protein TadD
MKKLLGLAFTILCLVSINAQQNRVRQDITGGAALIFKRPENPTTKGRDDAMAVRSATVDTSDQVEDAIALGNAARDRKPPDFESAEKAYRLAWKLNPRDPRPYLGLGNLYWDQRRYPEAAQAYRDAVRYMDDGKRRNLSAIIGGTVTHGLAGGKTDDLRVRVLLAATLLEEKNPIGAERELRTIEASHFYNAEWNGLFGYALAAQGRYTEAVAAYEKAVQIEPVNERYKGLLAEASQKARATSANDQAITRRLQNTIWEVRNATNSATKGTCQLEASGSLQCKGVGSGLTLSNGKWRVRDGMLGLEGSFKIPFCVGQLQGAKIDTRCYGSDSETRDLWIKL